MNKDLYQIHQEVLNQRNKHIAHADDAELEECTTTLVLNRPEGWKKIIDTYYHRITHVQNLKDKNKKFLKLVKTITKIVDKKWKEANKKVMSHYESMDIEEIYEKIDMW